MRRAPFLFLPCVLLLSCFVPALRAQPFLLPTINTPSLSFTLQASSTTEDSANSRAPVAIIPDTTMQHDTTKAHSLVADKNRMTKSPSGAVWRSLACPGWGQLYTESYWKAGLFFGGAVTCVSVIVWNHTKFADATTRYNALAQNDRRKEITYREKEFYRDQRDLGGLWLVGVYVLSAVDAYVGAHLYDFDVSDKGVTALPQYSPSMVGIGVQYRW